MSNLDDRITEACHRIEELYNDTHGKCYLSFSGGKDSTVLLALIKLCEEIYTIPPNAIPAVFSNTGIELDITVNFVKWIKDNYYQNVEVIRPEKSFSWVIQNDGKPIRSKVKSSDLKQWHYGTRSDALEEVLARPVSGAMHMQHHLSDQDMHFLHDDFSIKPSSSCCNWLKKKPFEAYNKNTGMLGCITGLRVDEGGAREMAANIRLASGGRLCTWTAHGVINKAPIIDWSDEDVEEFIIKYHVPLSEAYTKYNFGRTGCCCCPFTPNLAQQLEYLFLHEPNKYKASMFWLKDVYIAQNVILPFDHDYEAERIQTWSSKYSKMRTEMLEKYRPESSRLSLERLMSVNGRMDSITDTGAIIDDPLNILVLWAEEQTAVKVLRQYGHRAFSCSNVMCTAGGHPDWHIIDDPLKYINGDCVFKTADGAEHSQVGQWDIIIAEPPCTYTSKGGAARLFRKESMTDPRYGTFQMVNVERLKAGLKERDSILKVLDAKCGKVAIVSPVLMSIYDLPEPTQVIQPYMFGDAYKKQTCLWLKGLPQLQPTNVVEPELSWANGGSKNADGSKRKSKTVTNKHAKLTMKIFPGVAIAMAEQWCG